MEKVGSVLLELMSNSLELISIHKKILLSDFHTKKIEKPFIVFKQAIESTNSDPVLEAR
jgi:hypothetical protein